MDIDICARKPGGEMYPKGPQCINVYYNMISLGCKCINKEVKKLNNYCKEMTLNKQTNTLNKQFYQ